MNISLTTIHRVQLFGVIFLVGLCIGAIALVLSMRFSVQEQQQDVVTESVVKEEKGKEEVAVEQGERDATSVEIVEPTTNDETVDENPSQQEVVVEQGERDATPVEIVEPTTNDETVDENPSQEEVVFKEGSGPVIKTANVVYGDHELHKMDLYYKHGSEHAPIVFVVHGGSGEEEPNRKGAMESRARMYAQMGYVAVSPNYRYGPHVTQARSLPMYDVACSIATMKSRAAEFGADPDKIIVHGFSYGGYVSSFVVFDQDWNWLHDCDVKDTDLHQSIVGFLGESSNYGNLLPEGAQPEMAQTKIQILGPEELLATIDIYNDIRIPRDGAINYVDASDPLSLFIHGSADPKFNEQRAIDMSDQISAHGVNSHVKVVQGAGHGTKIEDTPSLTALVQAFANMAFGFE